MSSGTPTWDEPEAPETKPTPAPRPISQTSPATDTKTAAKASGAPSPQSPPSAGADAPQGAGTSPETAPKRRGRPPANPDAAKAPVAPPKEIGEMSLAELTKELSKAAAKAKAGHEALARIEELNAAIQTKLG